MGEVVCQIESSSEVDPVSKLDHFSAHKLREYLLIAFCVEMSDQAELLNGRILGSKIPDIFWDNF